MKKLKTLAAAGATVLALSGLAGCSSGGYMSDVEIPEDQALLYNRLDAALNEAAKDVESSEGRAQWQEKWRNDSEKQLLMLGAMLHSGYTVKSCYQYDDGDSEGLSCNLTKGDAKGGGSTILVLFDDGDSNWLNSDNDASYEENLENETPVSVTIEGNPVDEKVKELAKKLSEK